MTRALSVMIVPAIVTGALLTAWSADKTWVYDDDVTLGITVTSARESGRPSLRVQTWASIPQATVTGWTRTPDRGGDSAQGHRVRLLATRNGQPVNLTTIEPGAGPLADRLGVYRTTVNNQVFIKQCAKMAVIFSHIPPQTPAEYEIAWIIDNSVARVEQLRLPSEAGATGPPEPSPAGPAARDSLGTYSPGTRLGAAYPFSVADAPADGAGVVAASIDPTSAREFLGLGAAPMNPVLIGWQPDDTHGLAFLFSEADESSAVAPSLAPLRDLAPGSWVQAESKPVSLRVTAPGSGEVTATLSLAPGAVAGLAGSGNLYLDAGTARICALTRPLTLVAPAGAIRVNGLALISVSPNESRAWCVTETVVFREETLRPGSVGRWDGATLTNRAFAPNDIQQPFLATCFPARGSSLTSTRVPATPPAATLASDRTVIKRAVLCRAVGVDNEPVGAGTRFPADTQEIVLLVEHDPGSARVARIEVEIVRDGQVQVNHEIQVMDAGRFVFSMHSADPAGFERGEWELRIKVDGTLARRMKFTVG